MKKSVLVLFVLALISFGSFAQMGNDTPSPYHNLVINEKIHFQGDSTNSCYVVLSDVSINSLKELKAMYMVRVYKSKAIFEKNPQWSIPVQEITNVIIQFTAEFTQGDLFAKISNELKTKLLANNPTWTANHIQIE